MKSALLKVVLPLIFVGLFAWAIMHSLKVQPFNQSAVKSTKTPQQADVPLGYPVGDDKSVPEFDRRLQVLSPFTRAQVPVAHHSQSTISTVDGGGDAYNVLAAADGIVVYSGKADEAWGQTVVLAHKLTDGRYVLSYYGQLRVSVPSVGSLVGRGQRVGIFQHRKDGGGSELRYELHHADGVVFKAMPKTKLVVGEFRQSYNRLPDDQVHESSLKMMLDTELRNRLDDLRSQRSE